MPDFKNDGKDKKPGATASSTNSGSSRVGPYGISKTLHNAALKDRKKLSENELVMALLEFAENWPMIASAHIKVAFDNGLSSVTDFIAHSKIILQKALDVLKKAVRSAGTRGYKLPAFLKSFVSKAGKQNSTNKGDEGGKISSDRPISKSSGTKQPGPKSAPLGPTG